MITCQSFLEHHEELRLSYHAIRPASRCTLTVSSAPKALVSANWLFELFGTFCIRPALHSAGAPAAAAAAQAGSPPPHPTRTRCARHSIKPRCDECGGASPQKVRGAWSVGKSSQPATRRERVSSTCWQTRHLHTWRHSAMAMHTAGGCISSPLAVAN